MAICCPGLKKISWSSYFVICKGLAYRKLIKLLKNIGLQSMVTNGLEQICGILLLHQNKQSVPNLFVGEGRLMDYWVE